MIESVHAHVCNNPNSIALDINGEVMTYAELWHQAEFRAEQLISLKGGLGDVVALHLDKSTELIVMQLACWLANCAFMPLPIDWPLERKKKVISLSQCLVIVTRDEISCVGCDQLIIRPISLISSMALVDLTNLKGMPPEQTAYVIFTSGSTGVPKGVEVTFSGLPEMIKAQVHRVHINATQKTLWLHDIAFDASIADVWVALYSGATLVAKSHNCNANLINIIADEKINYIDIPSALLPFLDPQIIPSSLHTILVGGEVSDVSVLKRWAERVRVIIAYGPTEVTVCTSMHDFSSQENRAGLIGRPLSHLDYILEYSASCKKDEGELIVSGSGVAKGYISNITESSRFSEIEGVPCYYTGDIVRRLNDGYQFVGRKDRQFKFRGKLVCPEEIEKKLLSDYRIKEAFVFKCLNNITAVLTCKAGLDDNLLDYEVLAGGLPSWMQPTHWLLVSVLPRNGSGKVDVAALTKTVVNNHSKLIYCDPVLLLINTINNSNFVDYRDRVVDCDFDSLQQLELIAGFRNLGITLLVDDFSSGISFGEIIACEPKRKFINCYGKSSDELRCSLPMNTPPVVVNRPYQAGAALLTGGTGNLGSHLLVKLSEQEGLVFCVVRGGMERLKAECLNRNLVINWGNVCCFDGDITENKMGLDEGAWRVLSERVSDIFHCAADTSLLKSAAALEATNVMGTHHVMQLCSVGAVKHFHYASTLALIVDSNQRNSIVTEESKLNEGVFYGGYAQSKWQAEQLVQSYPQAYIYRFGLLVAGREGAVGNADWFEQRLGGGYNLDDADNDCQIDFTPLDLAVEIMLTVAFTSSAGTFHVHNPKLLGVNVLRQAIADMAEQYGVILKSGGAFYALGDNSPLRLFKMTHTHIDSRLTQSIVHAAGVKYPSIDLSYLKMYLKKLWSTNRLISEAQV